MKMMKSLTMSSVLALGLLCSSTAFGQAQAPPLFARDSCVKVRDGKWAEYRAQLENVTLKLARYRVESGQAISFTLAEAVSPVGRSARCDYHIVFTYAGFPPEPLGREQNAADMKKAGIDMTYEAMVAKRNELSFLVGTDTWRWRERVGRTAKGAYARMNYDKIHQDMLQEWLRMEGNGWKQLAEAASKERGTAWRTATLVMPGGEDVPYNAMTIDVFPNWAAFAEGIPSREIWNKVHPESDISAFLARVGEIRDRPRVDVVRIVEFIEK
jgi:hypothetical protein